MDLLRSTYRAFVEGYRRGRREAKVVELVTLIRKEAPWLSRFLRINNLPAPKTRPTTHPPIVCLCGSTRFPEAFRQANREESLTGKIVLSVGFFSHTLDSDNPATPEQKILLDELHLRKIDLADEVFVLNVDGYVGESLTREIQYARRVGAYIRWLEPDCKPPEFQ